MQILSLTFILFLSFGIQFQEAFGDHQSGIKSTCSHKSTTNIGPLHRYYNGSSGDHFYTTDWSELQGGKEGYVYERVQCNIFLNPEDTTVPLYRYHDSKRGDHFYTSNWAELGRGKSDYIFEGIQGYVYPNPVTNTVPLFRYFNTASGDHFYTTNWYELEGGKDNYVHEGISGYVIPLT